MSRITFAFDGCSLFLCALLSLACTLPCLAQAESSACKVEVYENGVIVDECCYYCDSTATILFTANEVGLETAECDPDLDCVGDPFDVLHTLLSGTIAFDSCDDNSVTWSGTVSTYNKRASGQCSNPGPVTVTVTFHGGGAMEDAYWTVSATPWEDPDPIFDSNEPGLNVSTVSCSGANWEWDNTGATPEAGTCGQARRFGCELDGYCAQGIIEPFEMDISISGSSCCDLNGDTARTCADLKSMIDSEETCSGPLSDQDKIDLVNESLCDCGIDDPSTLVPCMEEILGRPLTISEMVDLVLNGLLCVNNDSVPDSRQDQPTAADGERDYALCEAEDTESNPHSEEPVQLESGHKSESTTDLTVRLRGRDFQLVRSYTSDPGYNNTAALVGNNWRMSAFNYLGYQASPTVNSLWYLHPVHHIKVNYETCGPTVYCNYGPGTQYFEDVTSMFRRVEPGQWEMDYFLPGATYAGLIDEQRDMHGNTWKYEYFLVGSEARLAGIHLNCTIVQGNVTDSEAEVQFIWNLDPDHDHFGKLDEVRVVRDDGSGTPVVTQRLEYLYKETGDGLHADLGSDGDLIQVVKHSLVDQMPSGGDPPYRVQVNQYRYHDDTTGSGTGDRFTTYGQDSQLKWILAQEQIEYYAQADNAASTATATTLTDAADDLLSEADGSGLGLTEFDLVDMAAKIISYANTTDGEVAYQLLQSSCGCGGGGGNSQGVKLTYSFFDNTETGEPDVRTAKIVETLENGSGSYTDAHRTVYYDLGPVSDATYDTGVSYLHQYAIFDDVDTSLEWVWHFDYTNVDPSSSPYSSHRHWKTMLPSATKLYDEGSAGTAPHYEVHTVGGLGHKFEYTDENYLKKRYVTNGDSGAVLIESRAFDTTRPHLVTQIDRYRIDQGTPGSNDIEVTEFEYGFYDTTIHDDAIAWIKTSVEAELTSENGPDGTGNEYHSYELFDSTGQSFWSRSADTALTFRDFDESSGRMVQLVRNAKKAGESGEYSAMPSSIGDTASLDTSGWTDRFSEGGSLQTTYAHDLQGRAIHRIAPGDVDSYTVREMRTLETDGKGVYHYAEVSLPHEVTSGSPSTFDGPAVVTWSNADNRHLKTSRYAVDGDETYDPLDASGPEFTTATELGRSVTTRAVSGLVDQTEDWWHFGSVASKDQTYVSTYVYDQLGRMTLETNGVDTLTRRTYDALDRVVEMEVGTDLDPSDMETVAEYFYDSGGTTTQGIGDGLLSLSRLHTGDSGSPYRDTTHTYDFRHRRTATQNPEEPHETVEYDNLDRVTSRQLADGLDEEVLYVERKYSQRGLVYVDAVATDPAVQSDFLEKHCWYDEVGRKVAEWKPNSPGTKRTYDGLGRPEVEYITDRRNDDAPGATGNYADATSVTADIVYEQVEYGYESDAGVVETVTRRHRTHNDISNYGDLDTAAHKAIATYTGRRFDSAYRTTKEINFGTDDGSGDTFKYTALSSPPDPGRTTTWELVTEYAYNDRGLVETVTDPEGQVTKTIHDELDRVAATVENYINAVVSWDETDLRWSVTSGLSQSEPDTDRVTSYEYDGNGNIVMLTAHLPGSSGEEFQQTQYVYGTGNDTDSYVSSNDLLHKVHYPKEDDPNKGEPSTDDEYTVTYSYNRLGELRKSVDQNETEHVYTRDDLGRVTADEATIAVGSDIDDTIDKISMSFDNAGRIESVTSHAGASVANEVEFAYTKLWQVESIKQEYEGAVDANTLSVDYAYDTDAVGTGNFSRIETLTYPSGEYGSSTRAELDYLYFDSPVLGDDRISRVTKMQFDASDVVSYRRVGLNRTAIVDYVNPDVQLDRYVAANGSRTQGVYPGWDRFGRVKHHTWVDGDLTTHATETDIPDIPPIVELEYRYDKNSNRTHRLDVRPGAKLPNRDFEYHYDGLDRLTAADRGQWNSTSSSIDLESSGGSKAWTLDMLGNWDVVGLDTNGNLSTYEDEDDRDHNFANEIEERVVPGPVTLDLANDDAGNLRTMDRSASLTDTYTHDAWNRLVTITNTGGDVAEYEYNGLHWRTRKRADSDDPLDGVMDEERVFYYTANWQLLEEHIDDAYSGTFTSDRKAQQIWGLRYIDDAVARRTMVDSAAPTKNYHYLTDAQFSTVRMISFAGALVERISYDPYGQARHHWKEDLNNDGAYTSADDLIPVANKDIGDSDYNVDADLNRDGSVDSSDAALRNTSYPAALPAGWISDGVDGPGNSVGFDGYVLNAENSQYLVRFRCYDPSLGRWLSRDPLSYTDSMNVYEAVRSSPSVFVDPLGLAACGPPSEGAGDYLDRLETALEKFAPPNKPPSHIRLVYGYGYGQEDGDLLIELYYSFTYAECLIECIEENPEKLASALAKAGWNMGKDALVDLMSLPSLLLYVEFGENGELKVDGGQVGSKLFEKMAKIDQKNKIETLQHLRCAEDSFRHALGLWAEQGAAPDAGEELLRGLNDVSERKTAANRSRVSNRKFRHQIGKGLTAAGRANAALTSAQLLANTVAELAKECEDKCKNVKPCSSRE